MLSKQASNNMMPMEITPLYPPYSEGDVEALIFERELVGETELLRFWKS